MSDSEDEGDGRGEDLFVTFQSASFLPLLLNIIDYAVAVNIVAVVGVEDGATAAGVRDDAAL